MMVISFYHISAGFNYAGTLMLRRTNSVCTYSAPPCRARGEVSAPFLAEAHERSPSGPMRPQGDNAGDVPSGEKCAMLWGLQ